MLVTIFSTGGKFRPVSSCAYYTLLLKSPVLIRSCFGNIASQLLVGCVAIRLPDLLCNKVLAKVQQINAYQVMYVGMIYPAGRTSLSPWCTFMAHGRMATRAEPDVGWVVTQETQNLST